jgi:hypothetical protein
MTNLPTRVGNYQLERQIGKGGMSEVWLARHRLLDDRQVAVKLLLTQDAEWIERFTREAQITSRLRHEHIIQIYDHGYQHPYYYTVMEYVAGGALRELLQGHRPLPLELALHVFRCAGAALDYAHAHGVIHRDVSPGNILLEQGTNRVLLTDFGIARESGKVGLTTVNKLMGTPGYLSPEHASSAAAVTHLSDIYSLGVVLFEMLSGALPWNHNPGMPNSSGGPFEPPMSLRSRGVQGLPTDVDRIIQTMLAIDPAKRYPSARAAIEDLERVLTRHTSPTQVVNPAPGDGAGAALRPRAPLTQVVEPHPVEKVLRPDLLKGPLQQARKRAEELHDPQAIAALLDRWSSEGMFRRKLLGRQAALHRITSTNIYFYTLRVLYEIREPAQTIEEPDHQALPIPLEKEEDRWSVGLPAPKGFADDSGGTVRLPGSTRVIACQGCGGIGKTICPRCQGKQRISARQPNSDRRTASGAMPARTGGTSAATPAALLIPCPDCSGTGGLPCTHCEGAGRLVQKKTITWRRRAVTLKAHDDLPRVDEQWLVRSCAPNEVYCEQQPGGLRPEWRLIPGLKTLIDAALAAADEHTRIALSEVAIAFIPVTEIVFDLGGHPRSAAQQGTGKPPAPASDAGLYRWHIYGFENRLPRDWRFLNLDRIGLVFFALLFVLALAGLLVLLL